VVLALLLALLPGVAEARFTSPGKATATVETLTLTGVTGVVGSSRCNYYLFWTQYTLSSFDPVPGATSYTVTLQPPSGSAVTETITGDDLPQTLTVTRRTGTFRVLIQAQVKRWTGPVVERTFTC
jgi:hypothetical protein